MLQESRSFGQYTSVERAILQYGLKRLFFIINSGTRDFLDDRFLSQVKSENACRKPFGVSIHYSAPYRSDIIVYLHHNDSGNQILKKGR